MTLSVRLDTPLLEKLRRYCVQNLRSQSDIVKESLRAYLDRQPASVPAAYELGKNFFGKRGSGKGDLAGRRKHYLKEKLRAKRAH